MISNSLKEMKTNATNRRIRELITALNSNALVPQPSFQRRLVWGNKDRVSFIETVLLNLPFPEIYVCAGEVDTQTAKGTEWLVDGQQRISALTSYFNGDDSLKLSGYDVRPYAALSQTEKQAFLDYTVVVRDLGTISLEVIREVFQRINLTRYGLNAMELANARYDGAIKKFAERMASHDFYEEHPVFKPSDVRRMGDVSFQLSVLISMDQGYFGGTGEHEAYLERYNDAFELERMFKRRFEAVFRAIASAKLPITSRWFKKADMFSLMVEVDRALQARWTIDPRKLRDELMNFEADSDVINVPTKARELGAERQRAVRRYLDAAAQGSNHRKSRMTRGDVLAALLMKAATRTKRGKRARNA